MPRIARIRIESVFGKMTVFVTNGHLPYRIRSRVDRLRSQGPEGDVGKGKSLGRSRASGAIHI